MPGWSAAIAHAPPPVMVTVVAETLQAVDVVEKVTGRVEVAVADRVMMPEPKTTLLRFPKLIV